MYTETADIRPAVAVRSRIDTLLLGRAQAARLRVARLLGQEAA